jgi:dipeptidyl aminopeptidase/acylaminoacyl peptidase
MLKKMINQFLKASAAILLLLLLTEITFAQQRRLMTPADILRVAAVSDAQISPNGAWVVYTLTTVADDKNISTLWLSGTGSLAVSSQTPITEPGRRTAPHLDWPEIRTTALPLLPLGWTGSSPRWSPDSSTIAFLSHHEDQEGLWTVKLDRRDPRFVARVQTTNFFITYAGASFSWSPDSKRIAYISATPDTSETYARRSDDPRVIDRIQYKSRTALSDNRRTHVWVVDVERSEPRQLTSGAFYDHAVSFSPRGDEILFLSNHEADPDANNNSDIFAVDVGGQTRQITDTKGCEYDPTWSPDGKMIAYVATSREVTTIDSVAEDTHLWVIAASGGAGRELGVDHDRRVRNPQWSPDGRAIYFLAGDQGQTTIYRTSDDGGKISRFSLFTLNGEMGAGFDGDARFNVDSDGGVRLGNQFQITSFSLSKKTTPIASASDQISVPFVFTLGNVIRPPEIWWGPGTGLPLRRLTAHNDSLAKSMPFAIPEEFTFASFDGTRIQGWIMKGAGCREDRKCPLILNIHGGPHGMYGWSFNANFQTYVSRNFAVLYLNPRGSSGYGQKFSDGTIGEWGGGDYKDLMLGVDEALRRYSWIDENRLGVTGGSYGGFMTNWVITQTPRFRAAVSVASLSNLISFYSTSLYQDLIHAEFGGFPWDNYELLWQWSPLRYVRQVQTPTLFIHGENDNDVHITQAEEMYMALRRRGVDSVFVRYPREGHGLREPKHRVDALERTIAWFEQYLR